MDLSKLSPSPWEIRGGVWISEKVGRCCYSTDLEFIALARNAFDVMMRRGWNPSQQYSAEGLWHVEDIDGAHICDEKGTLFWPDPFTAMVEADKWYRENVDHPKTRSIP